MQPTPVPPAAGERGTHGRLPFRALWLAELRSAVCRRRPWVPPLPPGTVQSKSILLFIQTISVDALAETLEISQTEKKKKIPQKSLPAWASCPRKESGGRRVSRHTVCQVGRSAVGRNKAGGGGEASGLGTAVLHGIVCGGPSEMLTTERSLEGGEG